MISIFDFDILVVSVMMIYTSYLDLKKREVEDKIWIIFGVVGLLSLAFQALTNAVSDWTIVGVSIGLTALIGMGLFFFGFYGGADGKALIVLALFVPTFSPMVGLYDLAPLMVLTNGVLISMVLPIGLLILNAVRLARREPIFENFEEPAYRKLLACLLGYKQLGTPHEFQFSLERDLKADSSSSGADYSDGTEAQLRARRKKFDFSLMRDDFEEKPGTWVTPGIPLLVFFTAGFFALLIYGDLVIGLIGFIFHLP